MRPRPLMTTAVYARPLNALGRAGLLCACLFLLIPAVAGAADQTSKKAIWGPAERDGKSQFPIYKDLGVGIYQRSVSWADTAPTKPANPTDPADPAYQWPSDLDDV